MHLNSIFTTGLIVTHFFSLVCGLKLQENFIKCRITVGIVIDNLDIYLIIYYSFGIQPTIYDSGSEYARCFRFHHSVATVSGRYVDDWSALALLLFFNVWTIIPTWRSFFPLLWFLGTLPWHRKSSVIISFPLTCICKINAIVLRYIFLIFLAAIVPFSLSPCPCIALSAVNLIRGIWGSVFLCILSLFFLLSSRRISWLPVLAILSFPR